MRLLQMSEIRNQKKKLQLNDVKVHLSAGLTRSSTRFTYLPADRNSQALLIRSRCISSRPKNSKPCRSPSRYRTNARSFKGVELAGRVSSRVATSPRSSSPVRVTPIPSCPNSMERPHRSSDPLGRNTFAETRISSGKRGKRRAGWLSADFELIHRSHFLRSTSTKYRHHTFILTINRVPPQ